MTNSTTINPSPSPSLNGQGHLIPEGFTPIDQFSPEDVFVVGWPKSGNTWFQHLIAGLVYGVNVELSPVGLVHHLVPDVHYDKFYRRYGTPTFFKSHSLPRPDYRRVVYLIRDGRDAMVSYFHYLQAMQQEIPSFLELVISGNQLYPCKWQTHVEAWQQNPFAAEMLTIKYEDLVSQPVAELERFCRFINLSKKPEDLEAVVRAAQFKNLQAKELKFGFGRPDHALAKGKNFYRRGIPGSHKDEMPQEVAEVFLDEAGETLRCNGYLTGSDLPSYSNLGAAAAGQDIPTRVTSASDRSGIGVVLPALNCAQLLPAHLESMQPWLDLASEIVVVDSFSNDGTVELIRKRLKHPNLRIRSHPRGLYQSWNFGLSRLRTKYAYISTVGDAITRAGLEHLHATAEKLNCDVVVSRPRFIGNDGAPLDHEIRWPIDDVLHSLRISNPTVLEGLKLFFFTFMHLPAAVLGSSASNLYRTEVLQKRPFPTNYGTVGDGAWGVMNVFDCRLGVTPEIISTFRYHPKAYTAGEYAVPDITGKLVELANETYFKRLATDSTLRAEAFRIGIDALPGVMREQQKWHHRLELERERLLPWILNFRAWQARSRRNKFDRILTEQRQLIMNAFHYPDQPCPTADEEATFSRLRLLGDPAQACNVAPLSAS